MAVVCAGGVFAGRGAGDCVDELRRPSGKTGARLQRAVAGQHGALRASRLEFNPALRDCRQEHADPGFAEARALTPTIGALTGFQKTLELFDYIRIFTCDVVGFARISFEIVKFQWRIGF